MTWRTHTWEDKRGKKQEGKAGKLAVADIGLLFGSESACRGSGLPGCLSSAPAQLGTASVLRLVSRSPGLALLDHQTGFGSC